MEQSAVFASFCSVQRTAPLAALLHLTLPAPKGGSPPRRLKQHKQYYEKNERHKQAHRLITRAAAVECVVLEVKPVPEQGFYSLAERSFTMPEVRASNILET